MSKKQIFKVKTLPLTHTELLLSTSHLGKPMPHRVTENKIKKYRNNFYTVETPFLNSLLSKTMNPANLVFCLDNLLIVYMDYENI